MVHTRMPWTEVPLALRAGVADVLGSPVVDARTQSGGFSPGSADRVVTRDGRRAFVKTAWSEVNDESPGIHRLEASKSRALPSGLPIPTLLGVVDQGDWVAIVLEDVEGRPPRTPWVPSELTATLDALAQLAQTLVPDFPSLADDLDDQFSGWAMLAGRPLSLPPDLEEWTESRRDAFVEASAAALDDVSGSRLVHGDVRADNLILRPDGTVVLVDWPWAARGAPWFDALTLLVNVRYFDGAADADAVIRTHPAFADMSASVADRVLAALAGYFLERSLQPPAPGIPTLRTFQRDQALATLRWLREREARHPRTR